MSQFGKVGVECRVSTARKFWDVHETTGSPLARETLGLVPIALITSGLIQAGQEGLGRGGVVLAFG